MSQLLEAANPVGPPAGLIDRSALAAEVAAFVLKARSRVVVLHGKGASGKTELLLRWVIPRLRSAGHEVWYGDCAEGVPDRVTGEHGTEHFQGVVARKSIIVMDSFETVFGLPRDEQREAIARLFQLVQRSDADPVVVLVTDTRQLTSVYALTSSEPGMMHAVFEVKSLGLAEGLQQLSQMEPEGAPRYESGALAALEADAAALEEQGWELTIELITLIDARLRRHLTESGKPALQLDQYRALGGIPGILRTHLDERLDELYPGKPADQEMARVLLERVHEARAQGETLEFTALPARLGVADDRVGAVLPKLLEPRGLLAEPAPGEFEFLPPQLGAILQEDLERRSRENERALRIIAEGLRSWQQLGNLLPPQRLAEVYRARTQLVLDREQFRFVLQCALRLEEGASCTESRYWLRRVTDRVDAMDMLLACLFNEAAEVRLRGATLLGGFPEKEVGDRLRMLALTDPDPRVRSQAVSSLEFMASEELLEALLAEARNPESSCRAQAIEALRIFRRESVARVLQGLVNQDTELPLRESAIRVLSSLGAAPAIDALLEIALHDKDREDREAAARALGSTQSQELNEHLLSSIRAPSPVVRLRLARLSLGVAALFCSVLAGLGFVALTEAGGRPSPWPLLVLLLLLLPTGILLRRLRDRRTPRASLLGVVAGLLFALCASTLCFWVHGLARFLLGRWEQGLKYLGYEIAGGLLVWLYVTQLVAGVPVVGDGLQWLYLMAGVTLFIVSYHRDVIGVLFDTLVLTDTAQREARRTAVFRQVFNNPVASGLVFGMLKGEDPEEARWAKGLLKRYGGDTQPEQLITLIQIQDPATLPLALRALRKSDAETKVARLEELWKSADQALRRRIAQVLYRNPSERSLKALDGLGSDLSRWLRLRAWLARWHFRFRVWPLALRVGVLLSVPTVAVIGYHGIMSRINPAWSMILTLRDRLIPIGRKVATVGFLAEQYPEQALEELSREFKDGLKGPLNPVTAAVAKGLVRMESRWWSGGEQERLRTELLAGADTFSRYLSQSDSAEFGRALGIYRVMADAEDSILGDTAASVLVGFVTRVQESPEPRRLQAVDSLSRIRYRRALPVLDSLLRVRGQSPVVKDSLAARLAFVVVHAYTPIQLGDDVLEEGKPLLAAIDDLQVLRQQPGRRSRRPRQLALVIRTRAELQQAIARAEEAARILACDLNGDRLCDGKDTALGFIADDSSTEQGYRDLFSQYPDTAEAEVPFIRLRERYPTSVWPRKILAEIYHEYLGRTDSTAFQKGYQEMTALRNLPAYGQVRADTITLVRFESDFAEIALSAKRYTELDSVSAEVLRLSQQPVYRYNMALFVYLAAVTQGNPAEAWRKLAPLEAEVGALTPSFYNGWLYPGTRAFIQGSGLPQDLVDALLAFCRQQDYWYQPAEADAILAANRIALKKWSGTAALGR